MGKPGGRGPDSPDRPQPEARLRSWQPRWEHGALSVWFCVCEFGPQNLRLRLRQIPRLPTPLGVPRPAAAPHARPHQVPSLDPPALEGRRDGLGCVPGSPRAPRNRDVESDSKYQEPRSPCHLDFQADFADSTQTQPLSDPRAPRRPASPLPPCRSGSPALDPRPAVAVPTPPCRQAAPHPRHWGRLLRRACRSCLRGNNLSKSCS